MERELREKYNIYNSVLLLKPLPLNSLHHALTRSPTRAERGRERGREEVETKEHRGGGGRAFSSPPASVLKSTQSRVC